MLDGIGVGGGVGKEGLVQAGLEDRGDRPIARCADADTTAAAQLKPLIQPGDTILLNNAGATDGLKLLHDAGLDVRLALPEPRGRTRRLWLVGTRRSAPSGLGLLHFAERLKGAGSVLITRWDRPKGGIVWNAMDELRDASVRAAGQACTQPKAGGWRCAHLPDWMHVSPDHVLINNEGRHCLWAHPPARGKPLTIRFNNLPNGELTWHHGLSDQASRSSNRSPVEVALKWRGGSAQLKAQNGAGWQVSKHQVDGFLDITVRAQQDGQRHHCFTAVIR